MAEEIGREIIIEQTKIFEMDDVDAIMVPGPVSGEMTAGLAAKIREVAGAQMQEELASIAPLAIGAATVLTSGDLPVKAVIYAPNRERPFDEPRIEHIRTSVKAALVAANVKGYYSIAIPAPLDLVRAITHREMARAMIDEVKNYGKLPPYRVILVDPSDAMIEALNLAKVQVK